jgi:hypothetical protein
MSKKYKGKPCVYCTMRISSTADHVFARKFFVEMRRGDLPKVPACARCNGEKADLELYLTAVLPFGGRHADATENLSTLVPGRLAKNARLHRDLNRRRTKVWTKSASGLAVPMLALPFDGRSSNGCSSSS